ncbi:Polysaccharide pyruvyl transferase [Prevotella communis]|uniref:Polysaccharide pyruvyl transferase n=1 Tax=Prevotella communis TaxID=2913614 RepID=A0A1H0K907_9BACT|nr:polysaccharide pyruvyl transferase family protein [Prevotella communis]SDO52445.1 Polysaccharide pyruvyl transferase [Prevotella communis]
MVINVITRHSPSNYGSLLQSMATLKVLQDLGHHAQIIDYQRKDERGMGIVRSQLKTKPQFSGFLKRLAYIAVRYPVEKYAQWKFDRMRSCWLQMTKRYYSKNELDNLDADILMTGSDQVWGPMMSGVYDPVYFLQFGKKSIQRVAYAASFGKTNFDAKTAQSYKGMLADYDKITVREQSAVDLIHQFGLTNCEGKVLDPTLLLNGAEWRKHLDITRIKSKGDYVLLYLIHNRPEHAEYARNLAKEMGKPLIKVNPFLHQARWGERFILCPDVREFVSLIDNATMLVTDSFHGTCFAINLNKPFIELLPKNGTSTRNQSVLEMTGLTDRIVNDYSDYNWQGKIIDYGRVNEILDVERKKSIDLLKHLIS